MPVSARLSGVWYHKDALAAAGIEEPHNWEQLLKASQALNDPAKTLRYRAANRRKRHDRAGFLAVCVVRRSQRL